MCRKRDRVLSCIAADGTETLLQPVKDSLCPPDETFKCTCTETGAECAKGDGCRRRDREAVCVASDGTETPAQGRKPQISCPEGENNPIIMQTLFF